MVQALLTSSELTGVNSKHNVAILHTKKRRAITMAHCPVCGQPLPRGLDSQEIQRRVEKITVRARAKERRELEQEFEERLNKRLEADRKRLTQEAELKIRRDLFEARKRADRADREKTKEIARIRSESEKREERAARMAAQVATRQNQAEIQKLQADRSRDRARHEADRARLQTQLDLLSRKLEKQTAEQLGTEGEVDLLTQLRTAFPGDRIDPIRRGAKGADIIHDVMEESKRLGRIVWESKNVSNWSNRFISQAKQYQTQYETPHIVIVTRAFPQKRKGLCILKKIPLVEPRMAVSLASILREGIRAIGLMRATQVGRNQKAQEMWEYISSEKFKTRFVEIAESVESLRDQQQKERDWHENAWQTEEKLYETIDARRREIDAHLRAITRPITRPRVVPLPASG